MNTQNVIVDNKHYVKSNNSDWAGIPKETTKLITYITDKNEMGNICDNIM